MLTEIFGYTPVLAAIVALIWLFFMVIVFRLFLWSRKPVRQTTAEIVPHNAIVVDGSNAMFWGDGPSAVTLMRILRALEQKGYAPIVFFDANVGYVLANKYYDEAAIAALLDMPERQICVVSKGVIADQAILMFATDHNLRVVTNDRYKDWRVQFPHAEKKGVLMGGTWRDGSIVWRGKLKSYSTPDSSGTR